MYNMHQEQDDWLFLNKVANSLVSTMKLEESMDFLQTGSLSENDISFRPNLTCPNQTLLQYAK